MKTIRDLVRSFFTREPAPMTPGVARAINAADGSRILAVGGYQPSGAAAVPVRAVGDMRRTGVPALAVEIVAAFEGLKLEAYLCPAGVWTIGYGSTRIHGRRVREGDRLRDTAEARELLARDLTDAAIAVDDAVTVPLAEHERAALISIVQNVGAGRADRPGQPGRAGIVRLRA